MKVDVERVEQQLNASINCLKHCFVPQSANGGIVILDLDKTQQGQGKQVIEQAAEIVAQFTTAKFIIVCDDDVDVTDWNDIIWAITTRMDPSRDSFYIDVLSQPSRVLGMDATNKSGSEITREWGTPIKKSPQLIEKVDSIWDELKIQ
ncbi:hypothetical protein [Vibrio agarivorans]|uniref:hypothetical protein n=1 Tax=Vibrio agarivorans TaxID=153622 RepID=UPI003F515A72